MNDRAPATGHRQGRSRIPLIELFSDLVYVVALAQVSSTLASNVDGIGAVYAIVMLMAFWWVWSITTLASNMYDPHRRQIQRLIVVVTFGSLLMAIAVPTAFKQGGLLFAASYVGIHLSRSVFLAPLVRGHPQIQHRAGRILFWFVISAVPWIIGGIVPGHARVGLWILALAIDYGAFLLAYPVPRFGRIPVAARNVVAEHLAERYHHFFTIALGDAILVTGLTTVATGFNGPRGVALTVVFIQALLFWRIYTHRAGELLPEAIAGSTKPGHFLKSGPYTHLLMVAGAVVAASGFKLVLLHPVGDGYGKGLILTLGGPALFLIGRSVFEYEVFNRVSWSRPAGLLALGLLAPAGFYLPSLATTATATAVLGGVALADAARSHGKPPETAAPP